MRFSASRYSGRKVATVAGALLAAVGIGSVVYRETRQRERDYHEILDHMHRIEKLIRQHDAALWRQVEGSHDGAPPSRDPVHQAMLQDFERLSHLEEFAMDEIEVSVSGDEAIATYRVRGTPPNAAPIRGMAGARREDVPAGGELRFARGKHGWEMVTHRLIE